MKTKKLKYWIARIQTDNRCYNARAKTRKEVVELVKQRDHQTYDKPEKIEIEYRDAFDLMKKLLSEGGVE